MKHAMKIVGTVAISVVALVVVAIVGARLYFTDARLTQVAQDTLNDHFAGKFSVGLVHWELPLRIQVKDVRVHSPRGTPVANLKTVDATIRLLPLIRGTVAIEDVTVDGVQLDVGIPAKGQPLLAQALAATPPAPDKPASAKKLPLCIEFRNVTLAHSELELRKDKNRVQLHNMHIDDGYIWLGGDALGVTADLTTHVMLTADTIKMPLPSVRVQAQDVVYHFATETPAAEIQRLDITTPGLGLHVAGDLRLSDRGVQDANAHLTVSVDTENATFRNNLPGDIYKHLRGKAAIDATLQAQDKVVRAKADLRESRFEIYAQPIKMMHLDATWADNRLDVKELRLSINEGELNLQGHFNVDAAGTSTVGAHSVVCKTHAFPVKALVGQFVGLPKLLPETLSLSVTSEGRALLPPTSEVTIDVVPDGLPGSDWPGLPHSMQMRGRFLLHPDLLEVLKLEVHVEHVPSFAIQGGLPLVKQSVVDIIEEIHMAHPKGPLRRIPAAPITSDAL